MKPHWLAKLTVDDVLTIRADLKRGITQAVLAERYHVSQPAISAIVHGRSWRHVGDYKPPAERLTGRRDSRMIRAMKKHGLM